MAVKLGQVDLFTKRVKNPPKVPERALHIAIADLLDHGLAPGWLCSHFPSGELRSDATGALLKRMGTKTGWSDFLLVKPGMAQLHALELKRAGAKPTLEQTRFLAHLVGAGGKAAWADNYKDAVAILSEWGALSTRIHPQ